MTKPAGSNMTTRTRKTALLLALVALNSVEASEYHSQEESELSDLSVRLDRTLPSVEVPKPDPCPQAQETNPPESCTRRLRYLTDAAKKARAPLKILEKVIDRDSKVYFFGENHFHTQRGQFYSAALATFLKRDGGINCIALEMDTTYEELLEDFQSGKLDFDDFKVGTRSNFVDDFVTKRPRQRSGWESWFSELKNFLEDARKRKVRIFPVDNHSGAKTRNEWMQENLAALLNSGKCTKIMMPIGSAHLHKTYNINGKHYLTLPEMLRAQGIPSQNFLLISQRDSFFAQPFSPDDCSWRVDISKKPFGFITKGEASILSPKSKHGDVPGEAVPWGTYSAAFVVP